MPNRLVDRIRFVSFRFVEKLTFFGPDPQNTSVEIGQRAVLHCRVQSQDKTLKIQWLKRIESQQTFRADAMVFDSEQYEPIEPRYQLDDEQTKTFISKSLIFDRTSAKDQGQYICLIQNEKITNYKKAFLQVINTRQGKNSFSRRMRSKTNVAFIQV